jgi:hypothetical protein
MSWQKNKGNAMALSASVQSDAPRSSLQGSLATYSLCIAILAVTALVSSKAHASGPQELNIQGASAVGGDAQTVIGRFNGNTPFSVMGRLRDVVRIYDRNGEVIIKGELGYFALSRDVYRERPNIQYPDGQTRVWLRIYGTHAYLHGGSISIHSANGVLLDHDRIYLR